MIGRDVLTTIIVLSDRLILVDLDLDAGTRGELGDIHALYDLAEDGGVALAFQAIVEGVQVGAGDQVPKVERLHCKLS